MGIWIGRENGLGKNFGEEGKLKKGRPLGREKLFPLFKENDKPVLAWNGKRVKLMELSHHLFNTFP